MRSSMEGRDESNDRGEFLTVSTREEARSFLRRMLVDPANMHAIRRFLIDDPLNGARALSRLTDHEVLDLAAEAVYFGRLRVSEVKRGPAGVGSAPPAEPKEVDEWVPAEETPVGERKFRISVMIDDPPLPEFIVEVEEEPEPEFILEVEEPDPEPDPQPEPALAGAGAGAGAGKRARTSDRD